MSKFDEFRRIINGSMAYEFDGTVLELTGYYSGKRIRIDLSAIDEEMFDELLVDNEDDEYED